MKRILDFIRGLQRLWVVSGRDSIWFALLLPVLGLVLPQSVLAAQPQTQIISVGDKSFRALAVNPKQVNLHWKAADGQAFASMVRLKKALQAQGKTVVALMNAGIYSTGGNPAGLHVAHGLVQKKLNTHKGSGNFHLQPNGVFLINQAGEALIVTTTQFKKHYAGHEHTLKLATQSGPMLLINGKINAKFIKKSQSEYTRNGVCTTPGGQLYFFATDSFPAVKSNLYQFARAAQQLECNNALYLDGNISKLYVSGEDAIFHWPTYVGILSVTTE